MIRMFWLTLQHYALELCSKGCWIQMAIIFLALSLTFWLVLW
jgi:hypothetical protein